jgi:predicted glycosyltransferase
MLFSAIREHHLIKKIVLTHGVEIIVSDNRYGLYCRHAHSIFITHQISPVLPVMLRWAEYPLYLIIRTIIHQFNECWIPDYEDPQINLSGLLSHRYKLPKNARFIGILSRFNQLALKEKGPASEKYEIVVILSGPEPQLSIFHDLIVQQALSIQYKTLIISGLRENSNPFPGSVATHLSIVSHLEPGSFGYAMLHADIIICRSGYSVIMDLVALEKTAILVPTPGQTEQQYLAGYLSNKGWFSYISQHELNLDNVKKKQVKKLSSYGKFNMSDSEEIPIAPVSNDKNS